jgi:hypothetical protein
MNSEWGRATEAPAVLLVLLHAADLALAAHLALAPRAAPGLRVALALISPGAQGSGSRGRGALTGFAFAKPFLPLIDVR